MKKSEPELILNGRAALCAGRDDLSDEENEDDDLNHRFSKPENLRKFLESGSIPDAAMINAARQARNKKRIQGKLGMFVLVILCIFQKVEWILFTGFVEERLR